MKACTKCHEVKLESEFFVRDKVTGRLHAQCKQCYKEHRKTYHEQHYERYREIYRNHARKRRERLRTEFRQNMLAFLSGKACVDCGETDIITFELDHINPQTKMFNISQAVRLGYSWEQVLTEIKKCQIVCANCHKRRTAKQFGWYKV